MCDAVELLPSVRHRTISYEAQGDPFPQTLRDRRSRSQDLKSDAIRNGTGHGLRGVERFEQITPAERRLLNIEAF
jgi:hypothetical protein